MTPLVRPDRRRQPSPDTLTGYSKKGATVRCEDEKYKTLHEQTDNVTQPGLN